jgi:transcription termination/antitermination protein NusG
MNEEQKTENHEQISPDPAVVADDQAEAAQEPEKIEEQAVDERPETTEAAEIVADEPEAAEAPAEEASQEEPAKETVEDAPVGERRWYVIQTYSGQEEKVQKSVQMAIEKQSMQHKIFQILVPTEETIEVRGTKRVEKVKKMFPGYVFVEMILDDESWYAIRQTPGVSRFIGSKTRPTPVIDREMQRVLKQLGVKGEKLEITFDVGEAVRVISGPFRGYTGSVNEINQDKGKLKVLINIFGRDTPVEVNFEHAEKIS